MTSPGPDRADMRRDDSAKRRRTRAALIAAARSTFSEHGLSGTTIERITQAAGFTRGAFYSNFDSREALMLAVMDREREEEASRMSSYIAQIAGEADSEFSIEHLTAALVEVLLLGATDRGWQLALMEALPVTLRDKDLSERQLQIRTRSEADARALIAQGLSRLGRRPTLELDLIALTVLGLVDRILVDTLLQDAPLETFTRRAASDIATLLMHLSDPAPGA